MPEQSFVSGYYPNTNSAYPISFNFAQQPAWSTGTNVNSQPQGFEQGVPNYGFGALAPGVSTESQYMAQDGVFNPPNSGFTSYTAPYMNGMNGTGWSYFNNPSSFFFPTGNTELNLTFGTAETPNGPLHQDLYKPPPPQENEKVNESGELNSFENGEIKEESVEKALSNLTVKSSPGEKDINDPTVSSSVPVSSKGGKNSNSIAQSGTSNAPAKPASWAAVASQPAKPKPPPTKTQKAPVQLPSASKSNFSNHNGTNRNATGKQSQGANNSGRWNRQPANGHPESGGGETAMPKDPSPLLREIWAKNNFNPKELNLEFKNARFFIIKSYSEDDIFRSIKYGIWTSTEHGNRRLNEAFKEQQKSNGGPIYMLFSVNGSGHFCGVATMMSQVDIHIETGVWVQDKWKGRFEVCWIYVKDIPNNTLRHIRLENNENKPITNSRDTQEVPPEKGKQVIKILHSYKAVTSIFDDFSHYEERQAEDAKIRVSFRYFFLSALSVSCYSVDTAYVIQCGCLSGW